MHGDRKKVMRLPISMTVGEILQKYRPKGFSGDAELTVHGEVQDSELRVMDFPGFGKDTVLPILTGFPRGYSHCALGLVIGFGAFPSPETPPTNED